LLDKKLTKLYNKRLSQGFNSIKEEMYRIHNKMVKALNTLVPLGIYPMRKSFNMWLTAVRALKI